jgi:hypothetical protein
MACLIGIEVRFAGKQTTTADHYFLANRSIPGLGGGTVSAGDDHH